MTRNFTFAAHLMIKAVRKAGISFPATKQECMERAGDIQVQVDFDKVKPLRDVIAGFYPDYFENTESFYCAFTAARVKELECRD